MARNFCEFPSIPAYSLNLRQALESGDIEMAVKGEDAFNPSLFHEHEGNAVSKADPLIRKFDKPIYGSELIILVRAPDLQDI
jgi:hypothetical protein